MVRGEVQVAAALVVAFDEERCPLVELAADFLGPTETAYFSTLRFERRQRSYLLGRYAAKVALRALLDEPDLRAIEIGRGVFDQPIVLSLPTAACDVTISHTDRLAVALAFPRGHPMGIDIERVDPDRLGTILSQLSDQEKEWVAASAENRLGLATALWTAKEALSKVLRTGLMSPMEIYGLAEFNLVQTGTWQGLFRYFGQYRTMVCVGRSYALGIVLPKLSIVESACDIHRLVPSL
jgi:4'-phosphopantetheinyl transferase